MRGFAPQWLETGHGRRVPDQGALERVGRSAKGALMVGTKHQEDDNDDAASNDSVVTGKEWQPMSTTCQLKMACLRGGTMLYSGKMYHVHKETFQKPMHKLTLRSPFSMEELTAMRDACAEAVRCKVHELVHPVNMLTENMFKAIVKTFRLFGCCFGLASQFFHFACDKRTERLSFSQLIAGLSVIFDGFNAYGEHSGPISEATLEAYFRIYDWGQDGLLSHMDLFQGLGANNWQERHYSPKIIQVITRIFQLMDEEGRGEVAYHQWRELVHTPEMVDIFFEYFEIPVHRRQYLEAFPIEHGMWVEEHTADDVPKDGQRDSGWANKDVREATEYLCPDGSPVTTVSVFDRMGAGGIGSMITSFVKENTDAKFVQG